MWEVGVVGSLHLIRSSDEVADAALHHVVTTHPRPPICAGVAIQKAAASAEQKNPEAAVADARARGEIPKINELPAPWGPKPFQAPPAKELVSSGYLPAQYPASSSPLAGY